MNKTKRARDMAREKEREKKRKKRDKLREREVRNSVYGREAYGFKT